MAVLSCVVLGLHVFSEGALNSMSAATTAVPLRSDVPVEETWALEAVFPHDEAWETAYDATGDLIAALETYRGRVGEGPQTLLAALRAHDAMQEAVSKVVEYASLRRAEDATKTQPGEMSDRAIALSTRAGSTASFLDREIASLSDETNASWMTIEPALEQ